VYGKPLAKMAGQKIPLTRAQLKRCADIILKSVHAEIKKDMAKIAGLRVGDDPVPLPRTDKFVKSFRVRIKGKSTIEVYSDWPTASSHTTKLKSNFIENKRPDTSAPMEMWWLVRNIRPVATITQKDGTVVLRTTPDVLRGEDYWIHPGFRKYTFLERGLRKGRIQAAEELAAELVAAALQQHHFFP
jgi:hypothetical protein